MQEEMAPPAFTAESQPTHQPVILPHAEHSISRRDIDQYALKVLYRLARNNYTAYLVGGGVRDLLLKRKPKDFDISTNARPEQIKSLFRNCLLIGRRFRLAHIRYGDKIIETSTFRSAPENNVDPNDPTADLFQRDDNIFGSPEEDARRRDFTVNGLFYDIETFSVIDYVGGIEDLRKRLIRSIGDPCIRFREDPVRMIRAVRFASRLDFAIDATDLDAIQKHREELAKASPARLLEEICRLFAFSSGEKAVGLLRSTGLLDVILPEISTYLSNSGEATQFWKRLVALDQGDTVLPEATQALIFAVLFYEPIRLVMDAPQGEGKDFRRRLDRVRTFIDNAAVRLAIPRKLKEKLFRIVGSQSRFANPGKRRVAEAMVKQDWFPEALALAEINATVEGQPPALLNPWREMYADQFCSRDEPRFRPGPQRHPQPQHQRNDPSHSAMVLPAPAVAAPSVAVVAGQTVQQPSQGLSRSARRRRNRQRNKERKRQERPVSTPSTVSSSPAPENRESAASSELPVVSELNQSRTIATVVPETTVKTPEPQEATTPNDEAASPPVAAKPRGRRVERPRRAKPVKKEPEGEAVVAPLPVVKTLPEPVAATGPLTAASFYSKPAAATKTTKPAAEKAKGKKVESGPTPATKTAPTTRPSLDRSDEADLPMHWLDEI